MLPALISQDTCWFQGVFFQVQLGLDCFKRLSPSLHVISSLGCEAVRRNVEPGRPTRSVQSSHRPRDKSQSYIPASSWRWWVSFGEAMINIILLLYRSVWPLLQLKPAGSKHAPSPVAADQHLFHTYSDTIFPCPCFLQSVSLGSVTNAVGVCH